MSADLLETSSFRACDIEAITAERRMVVNPKGLYPHFHTHWEVKVYSKSGVNDSVLCLVSPCAVHVTTPHEWFKRGWALAMRPPLLSLRVGCGADKVDHFLSFDSVNQRCVGGLVEMVKHMSELVPAAVKEEAEMRLLNALFSVLWNALRCVLIKSKGDTLENFPLTERARRYIERYYHRQNLSVEEVATSLGVSAGHLANQFKREGLGTVRQCIVDVRLENARLLLEGGRYSVKEAAIVTGWNCPFYFSNCFKQRFDIPPSRVPVVPEVVGVVESV